MNRFKLGDRVAWNRPDGSIAIGEYLGWTANGQWREYVWTGSEAGHVVQGQNDSEPQVIEEVFEADL